MASAKWFKRAISAIEKKLAAEKKEGGGTGGAKIDAKAKGEGGKDSGGGKSNTNKSGNVKAERVVLFRFL